jgi:hypothetical protein
LHELESTEQFYPIIILYIISSRLTWQRPE